MLHAPARFHESILRLLIRVNESVCAVLTGSPGGISVCGAGPYEYSLSGQPCSAAVPHLRSTMSADECTHYIAQLQSRPRKASLVSSQSTLLKHCYLLLSQAPQPQVPDPTKTPLHHRRTCRLQMSQHSTAYRLPPAWLSGDCMQGWGALGIGSNRTLPPAGHLPCCGLHTPAAQRAT